MSEATPLTLAAARDTLTGLDLTPVVAGVRELVELVDASSVTRLRLGIDTIEVEIEAGAPAAFAPPADPPPAVADPTPAAPEARRSTGTVVKALLVGVFYRGSAPADPPFVEVGTQVEAGQQLAIVEAMKVMNPVVADRAGVVTEILATDGEVVEFDQPLFTIEPA